LQGQRGGERDPDETAFLRAVGKHFGTPRSEVVVLSRWGVSASEIPVVLRLSKRAGVSPDVVVARRRHGDGWMEIARGYSVHAGDFHVPIDGSTGFLKAAYERFNARSASDWREISLSDDEVVGLVNLRFLSRALGLSPGRVLRAMGDDRDFVGVFIRLGARGKDPPGTRPAIRPGRAASLCVAPRAGSAAALSSRLAGPAPRLSRCSRGFLRGLPSGGGLDPARR